ncbi:mediator of RNA polymerase II transcription subunit 25-like [Leguminivora glycinivorella]|uniref:mediator of RNA polymerase II transcription subunit 25-like n=1 Tax=Leguminivora glycinivorella TaxID=1035111 RepID=UPI00200DFE46|nr:mediator of RNA polymerase II transcription subunit 25-like [Leguminivora glycinivorella]
MVVNAPETPIQAELIFVIEATSTNGAYISELKTNYIIPTLEYFHGGALEEGGGNGSVYGIVTYQAADNLLALPVNTFGPFTCPQTVVETIDKIQFIGGQAESRACITEALVAVAACFEELGRTDKSRHVLLLCCSPPYSAYAGGLVPPGAPGTIELAARLLGSSGAQLSIAAARRLPALLKLYEHAGGDTHHAQLRNYAKDPRHLVLLRGFSLKERPPSPAPPPAPEAPPDIYGQGRGAPPAAPRPPQFRPTAAVRPNAGWLPPPRNPLYDNSALVRQLTQPSYPPPQPGIQRMPGMMAAGPSTGAAPTPQRTYIWSGVLEWMEKGKNPGDQQKVTKHLPCQVSANSKDIEPELKVDTWPNKLLMQLMPKQLISNIGGQYLKDSKSVLFHLQQNEALEALTKVMVNGFAGCVHFSPMSSPPQCDIKVLILLYTPDKKAYLGFIPNNQATFVDRLRKVIQQQKMTQIINKQMPPAVSSAPMPGAMPTATMAGAGTMQPTMSSAGMSSGGMSGMGMGGGMAAGMGSLPLGPQAPSPQGIHQQMHPQVYSASQMSRGISGGGMSGMGMGGGMAAGMGSLPLGPQAPSPQGIHQQMHPQGMMGMGGNMGGQVPQQQQQAPGGKGPRPSQLDGLEAARQQNLEKIQQLQQTLEAAHQQEAQFKSQMDIMSHLQAAQQQEQHYKQLEEQRKHQQQLQLQQQLQRGPGAVPRIMRPMMPSNPGLRHLLQQQPQYRPTGARAAPPQQFDDVNNYDFI